MLDLYGNSLDTDGLRGLGRLTRLKELDLASNKVAKADIVSSVGIPHYEQLQRRLRERLALSTRPNVSDVRVTQEDVGETREVGLRRYYAEDDDEAEDVPEDDGDQSQYEKEEAPSDNPDDYWDPTDDWNPTYHWNSSY